MSKESRKRSSTRAWLRKKYKMGVAESLSFETDVRNTFGNYGLAEWKFCRGICRIVKESSLRREEIGELNEYMSIIASDAHKDEYDENINGLLFNEIKERFKSGFEYNLSVAREKSLSKQRVRNTEYKIIQVDSYEEASKYCGYTSWCVTQSHSMYERYTNNRTGRFFFCLKSGYESEGARCGDNAPLDNYGLSMIAVSITIDGSCNTITCRWNHDHGGNDMVMGIEELEDLLGMSFYEAFPPFTREELHSRGYYMLDEVEGELRSGKSFEELNINVSNGKGESKNPIYNRYKVIELYKKKNILDMETTTILFKDWFKEITFTDEGYVIGSIYGKSNIYPIIENTGHKVLEPILGKGEYDEIYGYSEGTVIVKKEGLENILRLSDFQLVSQEGWFDSCNEVVDGYSIVMCYDELGRSKQNIMDMTGRLCLDVEKIKASMEEQERLAMASKK